VFRVANQQPHLRAIREAQVARSQLIEQFYSLRASAEQQQVGRRCEAEKLKQRRSALGCDGLDSHRPQRIHNAHVAAACERRLQDRGDMLGCCAVLGGGGRPARHQQEQRC